MKIILASGRPTAEDKAYKTLNLKQNGGYIVAYNGVIIMM